MLRAIKTVVFAAVLAGGTLLGLSSGPAEAAVPQGAGVQAVQYYAPGPYAYGRPYYGRPYYARPYYARPYPRFYARRHWGPPPRHFYGRPYGRHGGRW